MDHVLTPLCELARKHGTDKGGWHTKAGETCHNYTPTYHSLFSERRERVKRVLEIGVNYGGSLRMWEEYFPNAEIIGLDSNAACLFNIGRVRCFAADQYNKKSLEDALLLAGPGLFDVIIDDGSHEFAHQVFSAQVLLPYLAPGGQYVIEDINIDCKPEIVIDAIGKGLWGAFNCGVGIGKARCNPDCPFCHGEEGERLLVGTNE